MSKKFTDKDLPALMERAFLTRKSLVEVLADSMKPPSLQTAHESIAAAAELECVQPGTFVYVHGLKSRPELNGAIGRTSGALQENGRIPVRLDPPHEKVVALKPANLEKYLDMSTQRDSHPETVFRHVDSRGNVSKVVSTYQGNTRLRFNIGDLVECCVVGGWVSGEIVQLRYTEPSFPHAMPYQVNARCAYLLARPRSCTEPLFPHSYSIGEGHVTRLRWAPPDLRPGRYRPLYPSTTAPAGYHP